jgi:hypothetical protein
MTRVAYSSPEHVVPLKSRGLPRFVFVLVLLFAIWFTVVLVGAQQAWTDNPGQWAILSTQSWAWLGLAVFLLAGLYFLVLLVRREVPAKTYVLQPPAGEGQTASFLQTPEEGAATTAETERPPQP